MALLAQLGKSEYVITISVINVAMGENVLIFRRCMPNFQMIKKTYICYVYNHVCVCVRQRKQICQNINN